MNQNQMILFFVFMVAFFAYRVIRFKKVKAMIPQLIAEGAIVVDVRTPSEFAQGARPGSLNLPLSELVARAKELDRDQKIILCCASGTRSGIALGMLKQQGFKHLLNAGPWMNTLT